MTSHGITRLVRDLLDESEWPIQPVCLVEGMETHLEDVVIRRLAILERRGEADNFEALRMRALEAEYSLNLPRVNDKEKVRILTPKTQKIQCNEGFEELVGDTVFLRQLQQFFVLPELSEFYVRQEHRSLQEEVERFEQAEADLTQRFEQAEADLTQRIRLQEERLEGLEGLEHKAVEDAAHIEMLTKQLAQAQSERDEYLQGVRGAGKRNERLGATIQDLRVRLEESRSVADLQSRLLISREYLTLAGKSPIKIASAPRQHGRGSKKKRKNA